MSIPIIDPDDHADRPVENLSPDVSIQWIDGGRIVVSRFRTSERAVYDLWENWFHANMANWPSERLLCILYDLRSPQFGVTLYIGTKIRHLNQTYQQIRGPSAVVYLQSIFSPAVVSVLRLIRPAQDRGREYFTDFDQAVRWLQGHYEADKETPLAPTQGTLV